MCRELANPAYALETISRTFHGRDLFAPAAAHLANGVAARPSSAPARPGRARAARPARSLGSRDERIDATMLYVDSFGNIALNLTRDDVGAGGRRARYAGGARARRASATTRDGADIRDARPGDMILYEDSYRNMSVAINRGNAASMLHARTGRPLVIRVLGLAPE